MYHEEVEKRENIIAGIVGAFLFSLAGAVVWVILDLIGFYASISGVIAAVCAIQGYKVFSGKLTRKGVIIGAVVALLVLVLAWYGCFIKDVYLACQEWYADGEIDYMPSYFECFRFGHEFLEDSEIAVEYFKGLGIGLLFAAIGSAGYIVGAFKTAKEMQTNSGQAQTVVYDQSQIPAEYRRKCLRPVCRMMLWIDTVIAVNNLRPRNVRGLFCRIDRANRII